MSHTVADDVPAAMFGDAVRLRQVLVNLVGNAIKFTEHGSVRITVAVRERLQDRLLLLFEVSDTGIGIPADKLQMIFRPFEQVDSSLGRSFGGTGLGLAIASQIVTRMGGHIWVDSEMGRGSTFHCTVSLAEAIDMPLHHGDVRETQSPTRTTSVVAGRPLNVLVADDVLPNQVVAQGLLQKHGHCVTLVSSGREVLAQLESSTFDLLLLDVQMPDLDGFRTTELIRQRERAAGTHVPIVAMTAHAMKGDRERCVNAGMDGYVSKPLQWLDVETEISRLGIPTTLAVARGDLREQLMARADGDKEFVRTLLRTFLDAYPRLVAEVSDAVTTHDSVALQRAIHKLKGAIGNLLPDRDVRPLISLEHIAQNDRLADAHEEVVALNREMDPLIQELNALLGEQVE